MPQLCPNHDAAGEPAIACENPQFVLARKQPNLDLHDHSLLSLLFLQTPSHCYGGQRTAVMTVQAVVDLMTCLLTALLAARLASSKRTLVTTAALWTAALCPFTANYSAAVLTGLPNNPTSACSVRD